MIIICMFNSLRSITNVRTIFADIYEYSYVLKGVFGGYSRTLQGKTAISAEISASDFASRHGSSICRLLRL